MHNTKLKTISITVVLLLISLFSACSTLVTQKEKEIPTLKLRTQITDRNGNILAVKSINYEGIVFKRYYPYKEIATHIIGYAVKKDKKYHGKTGVEKGYDTTLQSSKTV